MINRLNGARERKIHPIFPIRASVIIRVEFASIVCLILASKGCYLMSTYPAWKVVENWRPAPTMAAPTSMFIQNTSYCVDMLSYYRPRPMEPSVGALIGVLCIAPKEFSSGNSSSRNSSEIPWNFPDQYGFLEDFSNRDFGIQQIIKYIGKYMPLV